MPITAAMDSSIISAALLLFSILSIASSDTSVAKPDCHSCFVPPKSPTTPKLPLPPVGGVPGVPLPNLPLPPVVGVPLPNLPLPPVVGVPKLPVPPVTVPPINVPNLPVPPVLPKLPLPPVAVPNLPLPPVVGIPPVVVVPPVVKPPVKNPCPSPPSVAPPSVEKKCPINVLKLGACVDLLGGLVHGVVGDPSVNKCCPVISGIGEVEAAACLCTTLKLKALNLKLYVPVVLQLLISCGKTPPPGFTCSL